MSQYVVYFCNCGCKKEREGKSRLPPTFFPVQHKYTPQYTIFVVRVRLSYAFGNHSLALLDRVNCSYSS